MRLVVEKLPTTIESDRVGFKRGGLCVNKIVYDYPQLSTFANYRELLFSLFYCETLRNFDENDGLKVEKVVREKAMNVGMCTRRAVGNLILVHPETKFNLFGIPFWEFEIEPTEALTTSELAIIYRNPNKMSDVLDGPFVSEIADDGSVTAFCLPPNNLSLGKAEDFGRIIRLA